MILVLAYCGLRWCELAALRVGSIDFLRRRLKIAEAVTEVHGQLVWGTPKSHETRSVPIPRVLVDELAAHVEGKARDDLVFTTTTGAPLRNRNARRSWFNAAAAAIGEPGLTPHELPHRSVARGKRRSECEGRPSDARTRLGGHDPRHLRGPVR